MTIRRFGGIEVGSYIVGTINVESLQEFDIGCSCCNFLAAYRWDKIADC